MTQQMDDHLDEAAIRATAAIILSQRGWRLLGVEDLARGALDLLVSGAFAAPEAAMLHVYAAALYRACTGIDGHERQERGYIELLRYLYDASRRFAYELSDDIREEVAVQAVAEIFFRLVSAPDRAQVAVRVPGAFLAVGLQQLRTTIRRWRSLRTDFWTESHADIEAGAESDPAEVMVAWDLTLRVRQCFQLALERYPRAKLQLWVVWMRQIEHREYDSIAAALHMTPANIRVLHARGVARLRDDPEWRLLGGDAGFITTASSVDAEIQAATQQGA